MFEWLAANEVVARSHHLSNSVISDDL